MKTIKAVLVGDVYDYAEPVPDDAVEIRFDGEREVFVVTQSRDAEQEKPELAICMKSAKALLSPGQQLRSLSTLRQHVTCTLWNWL